jgi:CRISPR type III-B/RAMP module-associated protein Cmr5
MNHQTTAAGSIERKRAEFAWKCIEPIRDPNKARLRASYYSLIRNFPSLVQSMGIGQALAFLMSKAQQEEAHAALRDHLTAWLFSRDCPAPWTQDGARYTVDKTKLLCRLLDESDPEVWWFVEEEAIAFALWLKRFTEAITPARDRQQG